MYQKLLTHLKNEIITLFISTTILLVSNSGLAASGDLLILSDYKFYSGIIVTPYPKEGWLFFKPPPTIGIFRIVGEKGVFLKSEQFSFDIEKGLFGWRKTLKYDEFLPVNFPRPVILDVYKAYASGYKTGIQQADIYIFNKDIYNLKFSITCKNEIIQSDGGSSCVQIKNSSFNLMFENYFKSDAIFTYKRGNEEFLTKIEPGKKIIRGINVIDSQVSILVDVNGKKYNGIIILKSEKSRAELPKPEVNGKSVTFGINTTLVQCGKKVYHKGADKIMEVVSNCFNTRIYQWSEDGDFLFYE